MTTTATNYKHDFKLRDTDEFVAAGEGHSEVKSPGGVYRLVPVVKIENNKDETLALEYHCFGAGIQIQCNYRIMMDNTKKNQRIAKRWIKAVDSGKLHSNLQLSFTRGDMPYQKGYMTWDGFISGHNMDMFLKKLGFQKDITLNELELASIRLKKNLGWDGSQSKKYFEREGAKIGISGEEYASRMNRNIYSLYDNKPDFPQAHDEIHAAIGKFIETTNEDSSKKQKEDSCQELNAVLKKWDHVGARDTATRENIANYIFKATEVRCFETLTDAIFKE